MALNVEEDTETPITPIPSKSIAYAYDITPDIEETVILDHVAPNSGNTIDIALKITSNTNKSYKKASFNYNPQTNTPYALAMQIITDHRLSSFLKTKIATIITECVTINEYNSENNTTHHNNDVLTRPSIEDEKQFMDALGQNDIITEDILNIYSFEKQCFITVGCILCAKCLYLFNATQLKRWKHFQRITNIAYILKDKTESVIDSEIALEMLQNMGIKHESDKSEILKPHLIGANMKQLRQKILLSDDRLLFEMNGCIEKLLIEDIYNDDVVSNEQRNEILESIWNLFEIKSQKQMNNDLWITLETFITQQAWMEIKSTLDDKWGAIKPIYDEICTNESISGVITVDLNHLSNLKVYESGFSMNVKDDNDILCCILNRNQRLQWITYFDAVLYSINAEDEDKKEDEHNNNKVRYDKFIHDFKQRNHRNEDLKRNEYKNTFEFGEILDYWTQHEINSVSPKYATLKEELVCNDICSSNKEYYAFYEKSRKEIRQKKRKYVQCSNPDEYDMDFGDEYTINHAIAMQIFADIGFDSRIKRAFIRNADDTLRDLMKRNMEIAHFCRYLKECALCFGDEMSRKAVYIAVDSHLLFNSMYIKIEIPLIASMDSKMTQKIAEKNKNGVVLALKAMYNDPDPRCFVMDEFKTECMIYGEYLAISNIFINGLSNKLYISAIQLFENVCNGCFMTTHKENTEQTLYTLIVDYLSAQNNIKIPKFIRKIFTNVVESKMNVWINKKVINEIKNDELRAILNVDNIFKYKANVEYVQTFEWKINNFKVMQKSTDFVYDLVNDDGVHSQINFYFIINGNRLRFIIKNISSKTKGIKIQIDAVCKEHKFQLLSPPKWITSYDEFTLNNSKYDSMDLVFGVKIMETAETKTKLHIKQQNVNPNDVDIDILTFEIAQQIREQIRGKYQNQMNDLNETINLLLRRPQNTDNMPQNLRLMSKSQSYSQISINTETGRHTPKRKGTFSLMDST